MKVNRILNISFIKTIYFNFHFLPFNQAVKLPILISTGVKFNKLAGKITLDPMSVKFGSVKIGFQTYGFQTKQNKTILELKGGEIIFNKNIYIGKGAFISLGQYGKLTVKENVFIGGNDKIICYEQISVGKNTRISWDVTLIDTDFHETVNIYTQERSLAKRAIYIGANNWIGFGSTIIKGTQTPDFCIIGAKSFLNKEYKLAKYCLLAGHPAQKIKEGIFRDINYTID